LVFQGRIGLWVQGKDSSGRRRFARMDGVAREDRAMSAGKGLQRTTTFCEVESVSREDSVEGRMPGLSDADDGCNGRRLSPLRQGNQGRTTV